MRITPGRRRWIVWGAALVLLALFWGTLWRGLDRSVLTRVPVLDEAYYLREAAAIQQGRLLPGQPFVMSPLYPYLVAATGSGRELDAQGVRLGSPIHGLRVVQAAMWLGIVLLLYRVGRPRLPGRWPLVPPLLFALYGPAAVFVSEPLLEIPLAFVVTLLLALLPEPGVDADGARGGARRANPRPVVAPELRRAALLGALLGIAILLRAVAAVMLVPVALALARRAGGGWRAARRPLLAAGVALGVVVAPAALYNSALSGRLVGPSLNGGQNFYIGQGKDANGFFRVFVGLDFEHDPAGVAFLSARTGRRLSGPAEADRFWFDEAAAFVKDHPASSAGLWLKKLWLHFVGVEIDQVTPLAAWSRDGAPLRALPVPWCVIAAAGLAGLAVAGRRAPWRDWALAVVLFVAAQSLFFVVSRYRLALAPALCLLAAAWAAEVARGRGRARLLAAAAGVAAALAVVPWGLGPARATWRAAGMANEARRWERFPAAPDAARAESLYRDAVTADPTQLSAWQGLARVLLRAGRDAEAERALTDGVLRAQPHGMLDRDLIALLVRRGRTDAAVRRLGPYLRDHPGDLEMQHNFAVALGQVGQTDEALAAARRLIQAAPDEAQGYIDLGVLLARAGRRDEAREAFARGLQRRPNDPNLRHNLDALGAPAAGVTVPSSPRVPAGAAR